MAETFQKSSAKIIPAQIQNPNNARSAAPRPPYDAKPNTSQPYFTHAPHVAGNTGGYAQSAVTPPYDAKPNTSQPYFTHAPHVAGNTGGYAQSALTPPYDAKPNASQPYFTHAPHVTGNTGGYTQNDAAAHYNNRPEASAAYAPRAPAAEAKTDAGGLYTAARPFYSAKPEPINPYITGAPYTVQRFEENEKKEPIKEQRYNGPGAANVSASAPPAAFAHKAQAQYLPVASNLIYNSKRVAVQTANITSKAVGPSAGISPNAARKPLNARFSIFGDAKQAAKNSLQSQDSIGAQAVAGYIAIGEYGIKTWKISQAVTPAAIKGTRAAIKVIRGTTTVIKKTVIFTANPILNTKAALISAKAAAVHAKKAVLRVAARIKSNVRTAVKTAKKAYTVTRGVLTGTVKITLPPNLHKKIARGVWVGAKYAGKFVVWAAPKAIKATVKTAFKASVKTVKIGGSITVSAGNMLTQADDAGLQAAGVGITGAKYMVEAAKFAPKAVKGVYRVGKTVVLAPVKTVRGVIKIGRGIAGVVKSVKSVGWVNTFHRLAPKALTAVANAGRSVVTALQGALRFAAKKIIIPLIIIIVGFVALFQAVSTPVQGAATLFANVFSIFSPETGKKTEYDLNEYVNNMAVELRAKYAQDLLDAMNAGLKSNGGDYDYVRLFSETSAEDQVKDALEFDISTILSNIYTAEDLVNLGKPIFNAIILVKYDLTPTETEAKEAITEIYNALLKYRTEPLLTEWCEYEGDDPASPHVAECGAVHARAGCPNMVTGHHTVWTCNKCDTTDDEGVNCAGYEHCQGHSVLGVYIVLDGWYELTYKYFQQPIDELSNKEKLTSDEEKELKALKDGYDLCLEYMSQTQSAYGGLNITDLSGVEFLPGERPGSQRIVDYALMYEGNLGGQPFWSWYGFKSRVEWCACFVSYVLAQNGVTEPKFSGCSAGVSWFQNKGQWLAGAGYAAVAGDIIFFDWEHKSNPVHVGIVIGHDAERVYTIEGNSVGDKCRIQSYPINSSMIYGYGLPNY